MRVTIYSVLAMLLICAGSSRAAPTPSSVIIPDTSPKVGTTWTEDTTDVDELTMVSRDGSKRREVHTRNRHLRQTVLAISNGRVTSIHLEVERNERVDQAPDGSSTTVPDATQGQQYTLTVDASDNETIRHVDGSAPTDAERKSVMALDFGFGGARSRLGPIPRRAVKVGESFTIDEAGAHGTSVLSSVYAQGKEKVADFIVDLREQSDRLSGTMHHVYTVSLRSGWILHMVDTGEAHATDHLPKGVSRIDSKLRGEETFTYP